MAAVSARNINGPSETARHCLSAASFRSLSVSPLRSHEQETLSTAGAARAPLQDRPGAGVFIEQISVVAFKTERRAKDSSSITCGILVRRDCWLLSARSGASGQAVS
jgi:hypothetical protein